VWQERTCGPRGARTRTSPSNRERVVYLSPAGPNPLDQRDDFSGPFLRHGSLNSLFQVALYLPSEGEEITTSKVVMTFASTFLGRNARADRVGRAPAPRRHAPLEVLARERGERERYEREVRDRCEKDRRVREERERERREREV